jgi:SAM-dependent methyltransferase
VIREIPRLLPESTAGALLVQHPAYFDGHPEMRPVVAEHPADLSGRTLRAFGDEWQRFPELLAVHEQIFHWYFEGPTPIRWPRLRVLDAGCGMGRWLHFARRGGAEIVGMDVSPAIDVAARREEEGVDFVQADLREPPFPPESFDLVYSLGVLHHLEDPVVGVRALARLVRPGGELRFYVYRTLEEEEVAWKRGLSAAIGALRRVTTRLPYWAVHAVALGVAVVATVLFLWPRRLLRRWPRGGPADLWTAARSLHRRSLPDAGG